MASKLYIAQREDAAYALLREHTPVIASLLDIDAPTFELHRRYHAEYRRAEELHTIGLFLQAVAERLQNQQFSGNSPMLREAKALIRKGAYTKSQIKAVLLGDENDGE
jgi:hypothetical protein